MRGMKTVSVSSANSQLGRLVEQVQRGAPVILVHKNKLAKLERYELLDPECDGPRLEAMLLEAVTGPHTPYSRADLEAAAQRVRQQAARK